MFQSLLVVVPAADLTLRSFFGVTLHTLTVESAKPPAIKLESSVTSTPVRPCRGRGVNLLSFENAVFVCSAGVGTNLVKLKAGHKVDETLAEGLKQVLSDMGI